MSDQRHCDTCKNSSTFPEYHCSKCYGHLYAKCEALQLDIIALNKKISELTTINKNLIEEISATKQESLF